MAFPAQRTGFYTCLLAVLIGAGGVAFLRAEHALPFSAPGAAGVSTPDGSGAAAPFERVGDAHLHNAYRVTDKVIAGAAPEGEPAFRRLHLLGVKTILSVDGAKPDVERARRFGMRYVHLPIGYDDVAPAEGRALAKALAELEGPIYVHCHHGKHRSAAAVAVGCVMNGQLPASRAESVLKTFETGDNYTGLWASAREARPVARHVLESLKVDYVETAAVPPLAEAMVSIDQTFDRLKVIAKAGWRAPANHPDLDPAHEALQLQEKLFELGRTDETKAKPESYRRLLAEGERAAKVLHELLSRDKPTAPVGSGPGVPPPEIETHFKQLGNSCTACHKAHRD